MTMNASSLSLICLVVVTVLTTGRAAKGCAATPECDDSTLPPGASLSTIIQKYIICKMQGGDFQKQFKPRKSGRAYFEGVKQQAANADHPNPDAVAKPVREAVRSSFAGLTVRTYAKAVGDAIQEFLTKIGILTEGNTRTIAQMFTSTRGERVKQSNAMDGPAKIKAFILGFQDFLEQLEIFNAAHVDYYAWIFSAKIKSAGGA